MRVSYTGVLERNAELSSGEFCTEPMEVAWAAEARWFVQVLRTEPDARIEAIAQISPDGLTWCDLENDEMHSRSGEGLLSWPVSSFGGWLRLRGNVTPERAGIQVRIYLSLKE